MTGSPHLTVEIDEELSLVRAVRGRTPLSDEGDIATMIGVARHGLAALDRSRFAVLIDMRAASFIDESKFEDAMEALRRELVQGFRRAAFLVETPTGKLQMHRFVRGEKLAAGVFDDEAKALAHLAR